MCGIAGTIGLEISAHILDKIQDALSRRGPDAAGRYIWEDVALLHTRLSIIDPEKGSQPMCLSWENEYYILVYNGEIYNTDFLRQELVKLGHEFVGHSDTEVLLHAYAQWGADCLGNINGIFSFAVLEQNSKKLFFARDRMGVKPFFYKLHEGGLIFASEMKAILKYPTVRAQLDAVGVAQLVLLGPGRMPGSGVFKGIYELEPGYYGIYQDGKWQCRQYWKLTDGEHLETFQETAEQVRWLVKDAIVRQMISDVPIGTFLSGGLDSSIITAICGKQMEDSGHQIHSFSVDYENNDRYFVPGKFQPESDNRYIGIMNGHVRTKHLWSVLTADDLIDAMESAVIARDIPGMADVDSSLLVFCADVRRHVKVALSGECADEIFGGYPWYRDPEIRALEGVPWAQNTHQRMKLLHPRFAHIISGYDFVMSAYQDTIRRANIMPGVSQTDRRMKEMVNLNHRWFMQTLLDRKDRMSMYNGLEVRVPFCDYRIAEYLYRVPWDYKDYQGKEKGLLRYAMSGILPDEVLWRKKSPYPKTYDPRYEALVSNQLNKVLQDPNEPVFQLLNPSTVKNILFLEEQWPWYGQLMKRPQTIAYILMINFWLKHYGVDILE